MFVTIDKELVVTSVLGISILHKYLEILGHLLINKYLIDFESLDQFNPEFQEMRFYFKSLLLWIWHLNHTLSKSQISGVKNKIIIILKNCVEFVTIFLICMLFTELLFSLLLPSVGCSI